MTAQTAAKSSPPFREAEWVDEFSTATTWMDAGNPSQGMPDHGHASSTKPMLSIQSMRWVTQPTPVAYRAKPV
jgi:hypothetical protein